MGVTRTIYGYIGMHHNFKHSSVGSYKLTEALKSIVRGVFVSSPSEVATIKVGDVQAPSHNGSLST